MDALSSAAPTGGGPLAPATLTPVFATFFTAILWGLWWVPIRWIEGMGLSGAQAGIICNLGAALAIAAYMIVARVPLRLSPRTVLGAALIGLAFSSYSVALTLSDVVRVILLFYLAPAWGKIIEWAFMGQRWRHASTLTLGLSLIGAYLVLGGDVSISSLGLGDVLALISGVSWAVGAALVFTGARSTASALTLATVIWAGALSLAFAVMTGESLPHPETGPAMGAALVLGVVYLLPILGLTAWSAQHLAPALLSFLFTLEIVSGVGSGALFLDEPFGLMQLSGGLFIISAALIEAVTALRKPAPS
ncbi:EamA family transporter [Rhodobacteraceae bacterium KMM 6894]|nr:EamA family transporter [Rhodobacteraceae bacterium KMM 6894]